MDLPPAHQLPSQSITVGVVGGAEEVVSSFSSGVTLPSLEVGEMFSHPPKTDQAECHKASRSYIYVLRPNPVISS